MPGTSLLPLAPGCHCSLTRAAQLHPLVPACWPTGCGESYIYTWCVESQQLCSAKPPGRCFRVVFSNPVVQAAPDQAGFVVDSGCLQAKRQPGVWCNLDAAILQFPASALLVCLSAWWADAGSATQPLDDLTVATLHLQARSASLVHLACCCVTCCVSPSC